MRKPWSAPASRYQGGTSAVFKKAGKSLGCALSCSGPHLHQSSTGRLSATSGKLSRRNSSHVNTIRFISPVLVLFLSFIVFLFHSIHHTFLIIHCHWLEDTYFIFFLTKHLLHFLTYIRQALGGSMGWRLQHGATGKIRCSCSSFHL